MAEAKDKSKSPALFIIGAFVVVVILMIIANSREKLFKLLEPLPGGVESLYTVGNQLVAISTRQEIFIWDWDQLDQAPEKAKVAASHVLYLRPDRLIWIPANSRGTVVTSNLKGDKMLNRRSLGYNWICKLMNQSFNDKFIAFALVGKSKLEGDNKSDGTVKLAVLESGSDNEFFPNFTINLEKEELIVNEIAVSSNGERLAVVGQKNKSSWIALFNVKQNKLLWENTFADADELDNVTFSPDNEFVYTSKSSRNVCIFDSVIGEIVRQMEISKYETPANNPQTISCVTVSPDSRFVLASTVPSSRILVWNAKDGTKVTLIRPGLFTVSGIAFSPDSTYLATSSLTGKNPVKIWKTASYIKP